jgi:hypothetical protein
MFVYLLIAVELAVLYAIYYVTFIHEVKPPTYKADSWGSYENKCPQKSLSNKVRSSHRPAA